MQQTINGLMSPELLILLAWFTTERVRRGAQWCEREGVGLLRVALPPVPEAGNVVSMPDVREFKRARKCASGVLAVHCAQCGGCPLASVQ